MLIARIPTEGIEDFRAYEDAVLPLLPEFNGRLERRLRNPDSTIEMHIISFASDADFQNYRNDSRRKAQTWLLEKIICEVGIASDGERLTALARGPDGSETSVYWVGAGDGTRQQRCNRLRPAWLAAAARYVGG